MRFVTGDLDVERRLLAGLAISFADWTTGGLYKARDFVVKDGKLYQCLTDHEAGIGGGFGNERPAFWNEIGDNPVDVSLSGNFIGDQFITFPDDIYLEFGPGVEAVGNAMSHVIQIKGDRMVGASQFTQGTQGDVPAPAMGDQNMFLRGDGSWQPMVGGGAWSLTAETWYKNAYAGPETVVVNDTNPGVKLIPNSGLTVSPLGGQNSVALGLKVFKPGEYGVEPGSIGAVPKAEWSDSRKLLRGDGKWAGPEEYAALREWEPNTEYARGDLLYHADQERGLMVFYRVSAGNGSTYTSNSVKPILDCYSIARLGGFSNTSIPSQAEVEAAGYTYDASSRRLAATHYHPLLIASSRGSSGDITTFGHEVVNTVTGITFRPLAFPDLCPWWAYCKLEVMMNSATPDAVEFWDTPTGTWDLPKNGGSKHFARMTRGKIEVSYYWDGVNDVPRWSGTVIPVITSSSIRFDGSEPGWAPWSNSHKTIALTYEDHGLVHLNSATVRQSGVRREASIPYGTDGVTVNMVHQASNGSVRLYVPNDMFPMQLDLSVSGSSTTMVT